MAKPEVKPFLEAVDLLACTVGLQVKGEGRFELGNFK